MRIAVCNNYPLDRVQNEVDLGETPDHLLFGVNYLQEAGHECTIINNEVKISKFLKLLKYCIPYVHWGDLSKQSYILKYKENFDYIFSPCGNMTNALQLLRSYDKFNVPIGIVQHHPVIPGRLDKLRFPLEKKVWEGVDHIFCLSKYAEKSMLDKYKSVQSIRSINWGCDTNFYNQAIYPGNGLVIAGRTARDFQTIINAVNNTHLKTTIFHLEGDVVFNGSMSSNIKLVSSRNEQPEPGNPKIGWLRHKDLLPYFQNSRVIGIPLFKQNSLAGLTSLMDSLGAGKPVIMTRNPNIDIDIEKEGVGHWVEPRDVEGWRRIINWYENNPLESSEMGKRARYLASKTYSSAMFSKKLIKCINH